jgi:hypothetical protein
LKLSPAAVLEELRSNIQAASFNELLYDFVYGEAQKGTPRIEKKLAIGWGKSDHLCPMIQLQRILNLFPDQLFMCSNIADIFLIGINQNKRFNLF